MDTNALKLICAFQEGARPRWRCSFCGHHEHLGGMCRHRDLEDGVPCDCDTRSDEREED